MDYELIKSKGKKFYEVLESEIVEAEKAIGITIPDELKEFYRNLGYGFFCSEQGNINRLMDPLSVRDFRLRQNDFKYYPDIQIYDYFEENKLIFFEVNESMLFSIQTNIEGKCKIYNYDKVIADSLEEFVTKIIENETYYRALI